MVIEPGETFGMPGNAIAYDGPIDLIGSPRKIARCVSQLLSLGALSI
jgi:hypothetical protein